MVSRARQSIALCVCPRCARLRARAGVPPAVDLSKLPPRPPTPRTHASAQEVLKEPAFVQSAPTVAHVYAMKQLDRFVNREVLDQWRLRAMARANGELVGELRRSVAMHDVIGAAQAAKPAPFPLPPRPILPPERRPRRGRSKFSLLGSRGEDDERRSVWT